MFGSWNSETLNSFDLVDSGKHLDWDGNSNYKYSFQSAVRKYNAYKSGIIRADSLSVIQDVDIADYYEVSSVVTKTTSNGHIRFNQYNMDSQTDNENLADCMFALGMALGLGKTSVKTDVMYQYVNSVTDLSANDKASYDEAYKKY